MATSSEAVNSVFNNLLGRNAGTAGLDYWGPEWEANKQAAIDSGMSLAAAEAAATASISKNIGKSSEAFNYIRGQSDLATTAYDSAAMGIPDWFEFQDENVNIGVRPEDWATDLKTSNLENYLDHQNYSYGMLQGNTVGQEGNEWWGYQTTQDIQSYLAQGKSWDEAYKLATDQVTSDISANTGHQNYKKFGTIGYGNPLEIKTGIDDDGDVITEDRYLNLHAKAIADGNILNPTGTKTATQYELDDDGNIKLDDDGNQVVATDDDGNPITATPYSWQYVPDSTAPGGYRITAVPFNTGTQTSTTGHDFHMANYELDGAFRGGGGANPFVIPTGVQNVDATQFTSGGADKLDLATWAETPTGKLAIEAGNFGIKNKWFQTGADGNLIYTPSGIDHSTTDSNLGLAAGETTNIDWGEGWQTNLSGGPKTSNYVPPVQQQTMGGAGGGNTIINLDTNQKSTTAADKALKIEDRAMASGQGRRGFSTSKYKPTGNIRTLGIV